MFLASYMAGHLPKGKRPRYVLIIEDNVHHAELLTEVLDRHFAPVIVHTVETINDAIEFAGQSTYDIVITAGVIRDVPITEALPKLVRISAGTPIIVISGRGDETLAAGFIKKGATEYLGKTRETLENLPALLEKHFSKSVRGQRKKTGSTGAGRKLKSGIPSPAEIIREVDRITQQALTIAGPRRRKRRLPSADIEQLDRLLGQIQNLRELATKLIPRE